MAESRSLLAASVLDPHQGTLKVWTVPDAGLQFKAALAQNVYPVPVAMSPRGDVLAVADGCSVRLWAIRRTGAAASPATANGEPTNKTAQTPPRVAVNKR